MVRVILVCGVALAVGCGGGGGHSPDGGAAVTPTVVVSATPMPTPTVAPALAFAVGSALVSRSEDGGGSWRDVFTSGATTFRGVDFVDRSTGWVVGAQHIFRTDTGGQDAGAWINQDANVPVPFPDLYDVAFRDVDHGVAVGVAASAGDAAVLVTADGGAHWRPAAVPTGGRLDRLWLRRLCLTADGRGFAVGSTLSRRLPIALRTVDGGESWTDVTTAVSSAGGEFVDCSFREPTRAWIVGTRSFLSMSSDGGETWTPVEVGAEPDVVPLAVLFADRAHGWVCGFDRSAQEIVVFTTADGGVTWQTQRLLPVVVDESHQPLAAFAALDAESVVLVGTDPRSFRPEVSRPFSFTSHDGGRTWSPSVIPAGYQSFVDAVLVP